MRNKKTFPSEWYDISERIRKRNEKEKQVKNKGGSKFQQLEARLTDLDSGKLIEDIVIYAIRTIDDITEAKDFLNGYVLNIEKNPDKYLKKECPLDYAKKDIVLVLNMHFTSNETHQLWNDAIN